MGGTGVGAVQAAGEELEKENDQVHSELNTVFGPVDPLPAEELIASSREFFQTIVSET